MFSQSPSQSHTWSSTSSPSSAHLPLINSGDASFELELHRRRAFFAHDHEHDSKAPADLEQLERALGSRRASPEPDEAYLASFQRRLRNSCNEAAVVQGVMPRLVPIDRLLDRENVMTVPNQQWDKECALPIPPSAQYRIPPPKPDQTIGPAASNFTAFERALAHLAHAARPIRSLANLTFPLVTVEAKGDRGHNVCRSQSLHNAAVMLHQLLRLWQLTGRADDLYGRSLVCTISITTQTCAVSHYWLEAGDASGAGVAVYGRLFKSWTLNLREPIDLGAIVGCIRNAIDLAVDRGTALILERLHALEHNLSSSLPPSPPSSSLSSSPSSSPSSSTPSSSTPSSSPSYISKRRLRRRDTTYHPAGSPSPDGGVGSTRRRARSSRVGTDGRRLSSRRSSGGSAG
jgi:hypothetical protein